MAEQKAEAALSGVAVAAAAEEFGRYAASSPRAEAVEVLLSEEADQRASLAPLREWEVQKVREIDRAIDDYADMPDVAALFGSWRNSIVETARGRNGEVIKSVMSQTLRVDNGHPKERVKRLLFPRRKQQQEDEYE